MLAGQFALIVAALFAERLSISTPPNSLRAWPVEPEGPALLCCAGAAVRRPRQGGASADSYPGAYRRRDRSFLQRSLRPRRRRISARTRERQCPALVRPLHWWHVPVACRRRRLLPARLTASPVTAPVLRLRSIYPRFPPAPPGGIGQHERARSFPANGRSLPAPNLIPAAPARSRCFCVFMFVKIGRSASRRTGKNKPQSCADTGTVRSANAA